jgi:hypothetical protein
MPETETIKNKLPEEPKKIEKVVYSDDELKYRSLLIQKLVNARTLRDQPHPELDGMTYLEYYESNRKKDLSYIPPKKNKQDVRIVSGLTREKDTTLLSTVLNMNLTPDITAFDKEDMVVAEYGDNMADMVKKSREIENWQKKRPIIYRELISQGDVFVEELELTEFRKMPIDELNWDPTKNKISELSFRERLQKVYTGCQCRMVDGRKVYRFNIRKEYIEDDDGAAVMNIYTRDQAKTIYGQWERWDNVPDTIETSEYMPTDGSIYKDWNLVNIEDKDKVAEIKIYLPLENRFMIMLNGVMMLPINYPLTAISPDGSIPMTQGKNEPISGFAYSKSTPSKTKVDQEMLDEVSKLMIEGMRQWNKPPMGTTGKKVYGSNIFNAGKITPGIKKDEIFPLFDSARNMGANVSFYELFHKSIEEKTVNDNYSGDQNKAQTATEVVEDKNAQMMKLGHLLDGVVNMERQLTWNRLFNILDKWTQPIDQKYDDTKKGIVDVYRKFSVETTLENGEEGNKIYRFDPEYAGNPRDLEDEENEMSKKNGTPTRIVYMNPIMMRSLKWKWFIIINPAPKSNDALSQLLFVNNLTQAINLFGPESINQDYAKQRYAIITNESYNKFFKKPDVMTMLRNNEDPEGSGPGGMLNGMKPSVADTAGTKSPMRAGVK